MTKFKSTQNNNNNKGTITSTKQRKQTLDLGNTQYIHVVKLRLTCVSLSQSQNETLNTQASGSYTDDAFVKGNLKLVNILNIHLENNCPQKSHLF